jgi:hypothetical protein
MAVVAAVAAAADNTLNKGEMLAPRRPTGVEFLLIAPGADPLRLSEDF